MSFYGHGNCLFILQQLVRTMTVDELLVWIHGYVNYFYGGIQTQQLSIHSAGHGA